MKVFKEFEICDVLDIEETILASWLKLMERHYHQQNSYHNSTHAADVLQATTYFVNILQDLLVSQGVSAKFSLNMSSIPSISMCDTVLC